MKILLTGDPHSGKSTLLKKVIGLIDNTQGFLTSEVLGETAVRQGFELVSSDGQKATIASVTSESDIRVSRYGVDVLVFEAFINHLSPIHTGSVLYIDEIGQMQLYSERFRQLVDEYITANNHFIGTLSKVYDDELITTLRKNRYIKIIEVTVDNRDDLVDELVQMLRSS